MKPSDSQIQTVVSIRLMIPFMIMREHRDAGQASKLVQSSNRHLVAESVTEKQFRFLMRA